MDEKETKVRGEWRHLQGYHYIAGKLISYDKYKCSECGCVRDKKYSICPNCGIKIGVIKMRLIGCDSLLERIERIENWKRKYRVIG